MIEAVFYNMPVFEIKPNSQYIISLDDYLLVRPESITNLELKNYPEDVLLNVNIDIGLRKITITAGNKNGFFALPCVVAIEGKSSVITIFISIKTDVIPENSGIRNDEIIFYPKSASVLPDNKIFSFFMENKFDNSEIYFVINNQMLYKAEDFYGNEFKIEVPYEYISKAVKSELSEELYKLSVIFVNAGNYKKNCYYLKNGAAGFNWRDSVMYFLFTDRFYNYKNPVKYKIKDAELADRANYNGGNFNGIAEKINGGYFEKLGINTIWISPVVSMMISMVLFMKRHTVIHCRLIENFPVIMDTGLLIHIRLKVISAECQI